MENKGRNRAIVAMVRSGVSYRKTAEHFGLSPKRVWEIVDRDWLRYDEDGKAWLVDGKKRYKRNTNHGEIWLVEKPKQRKLLDF